MRALCFGSLNIDSVYQVDHILHAGETVSAQFLEVHAGGKGLNQAVALARAGAPTSFAGAIGPDGTFLKETLDRAGVDASGVRTLAGEQTGHAFIQRDAAGENGILIFGGANRKVERGWAREVLCRFGSGDFLVLQNEINEVAYLIEQGHERGMRVVFTPAPMDGSVPGYPLGLVDFLFLNGIEATQLVGCPPRRGSGTPAGAASHLAQHPDTAPAVDPDVLIARLCERFPKTVIVLTLGAGGSVCALGDGKLAEGAAEPLEAIRSQGGPARSREDASGREAPVLLDGALVFREHACPVHPVDTTGAGDTYAGFFIAGLMRGLSVPAAMFLASKAAAISVTRPGAAPSIPTLDEVERWRPAKG